MGRLFWKFFLAFWLALVTAGVGVGVVVWLHRPNDSMKDFGRPDDPRARLLLRAAAQTLAHGGPSALGGWLRDMSGIERMSVYAVDRQGRDVLGRPVDAGELARAREAAAMTGRQTSVAWVTYAPGSALLLFIPETALRPPAMLPPMWAGGVGPPTGPGPGPRPGPPPPWLHMIAALIASLAFSAVLAWYVAKPIRRLREATRAIASGHLETRIQPAMGGRRDELADLGRDFDAMAQQLDELIGGQRRLFHDVSHELRSPLARLQAAVGLARRNPDKLEAMLDRLDREAGRLNELVGEILALARYETGVLEAQLFDAQELLEGIVDDARFEAEARGCTLEFTGGEEAWIGGTREWLGRAFENVVRNAIKYTPVNSIVSVTSKVEAASTLAVTVQDCGPGVSDAELDAIFKPFYRGRQQGDTQGFGLGLAIARSAVQAHGGRISARRAASGGLAVEIVLPVRVVGGRQAGTPMLGPAQKKAPRETRGA